MKIRRQSYGELPAETRSIDFTRPTPRIGDYANVSPIT